MFFAKTNPKQPLLLHSGLYMLEVSLTPANKLHSLKPYFGIMCHIVNQADRTPTTGSHHVTMSWLQVPSGLAIPFLCFISLRDITGLLTRCQVLLGSKQLSNHNHMIGKYSHEALLHYYCTIYWSDLRQRMKVLNFLKCTCLTTLYKRQYTYMTPPTKSFRG